MKKIWNLSVLIGLLILVNSCANDIDLTAEFKDIPVVYGVLSANEEDHYIKVERAFLGGDNDNALEIAKIPDSIYYQNLDVKVEHISSGDVFTLQRVEGGPEGFDREEGVFAEEPNYLYKFSTELVEGEEYVLRINRGDNKPEITASTTVVSDFTFTSPVQPTDINIRYRTFSLAWKKKADAYFYDVKMLIKFLEEDPNNLGVFEEQSIVWDIAENQLADSGGSNTFATDFNGEEFYRFLGAELDDNGGADRIFISLDFIVDAGGQAIYDYINIGRANTGITSSQLIPTYSNISEGFGVFSSRRRVLYENFTLKAEARDSLANGIYTRDLGFQD